VRSAVEDVVRKQRAIGLDIVNDGEQGEPDYLTYLKDRFTGFEGESGTMPMGADLKDFPGFAARTRTAAS
jgi:5-methyltetrahydropteroyltriglutamate--homocysteine methyltransferase